MKKCLVIFLLNLKDITVISNRAKFHFEIRAPNKTAAAALLQCYFIKPERSAGGFDTGLKWTLWSCYSGADLLFDITTIVDKNSVFYSFVYACWMIAKLAKSFTEFI